ncbi:hypothetical protein [Streptomyces sp. NPDC056061]|uniref:hypothetical protein n=1 Tax=Streptomyces sp. NPDC056061 TaxID=3345700 RepID=UPI0035DE8D5E
MQKALSSAWPESRKLPSRATRLNPFKPLIDQVLRADLDAPRKQRHMVERVFERLLDEHGANEISYQTVRGYVAGRREDIRIQAGRGAVEAFVPRSEARHRTATSSRPAPIPAASPPPTPAQNNSPQLADRGHAPVVA